MDLIIYILLIHLIADFGLQTDDQAQFKSTDEWHLMRHVGVYSLVWFFAAYPIFHDWGLCFAFSCATYIGHVITDYATSRIGKPFWEKKDYHNGFLVVGFDQFFHYIQLFYTVKWLLWLEV